MNQRKDSGPPVGEDSFLDVVANLVGILIILVAVVSIEAGKVVRKSLEQPTQEQELAALTKEMQGEMAAAEAIRTDSERLAHELRKQNYQNGVLEQTRLEMSIQNEIVERELKRRLGEVGQTARREFEQLQEYQALTKTVEQLKSQIVAVDTMTTPHVEKIKHYPTPIAKTVFANEVHFRLANGKISFVPIDSLLQKLKTQAESKVAELARVPEVSGQVGPDSGYVMDYRLAGEAVQRGTERGMQIRFLGFNVQPTAGLNEELVDEAMLDSSELCSRLKRLPSEKTTVSLWVYPDSFSEYVRLKDWLREQGFQIAGWPLEQGALISGGPNGLRTSAQ